MSKIRSLDDLAEETFSLQLTGRYLTGLAVLSLRIAMKAFCSTYHSMRGRFH